MRAPDTDVRHAVLAIHIVGVVASAILLTSIHRISGSCVRRVSARAVSKIHESEALGLSFVSWRIYLFVFLVFAFVLVVVSDYALTATHSASLASVLHWSLVLSPSYPFSLFSRSFLPSGCLTWRLARSISFHSTSSVLARAWTVVSAE
ncbi:hypothetical protein V1527DRAFT_33622 [Lipomyces starkeyi]